eukprot:6187925-Pleurochrysis_carterae.AAC.1
MSGKRKQTDSECTQVYLACVWLRAPLHALRLARLDICLCSRADVGAFESSYGAKMRLPNDTA